ncbi:hypothetical protein NC661_09830 [Aquibacillus koreensis]|uniref:Lipoprotein n=1 Tax=Aquibacillus koreensis TaxID=279446 RepID=A0A9X4AI11_9BACI|nr:hypothetical protein [Aquibacillus koreensis]MCT2534346.1 hypothetical protein [Aquibacillus koreensis]MDC3420667.1 hypothetical protein [Aquibacillus koreensis]
MKNVLWVIIILLFVLTACSKGSPTITKVESDEQTTTQKIALIENELEDDEDEENKELLLEFQIPNEKVTINLEHIGILKSYLVGVENPKQEIRKMRLRPLNIPNHETLYLLQFSCFENSCSYLLLDQTEDGRSYLLADLATFEKVLPSPDYSKLLFVFNKKVADTSVVKHKVVTIDLEEFVPIHPTQHKEISSNYQWHIASIDWNDSSTLSVSLPNIDSPDSSELIKWMESERDTKDISISFENN